MNRPFPRRTRPGVRPARHRDDGPGDRRKRLRKALAALALATALASSARGGETARDMVFLAEDRPVFLRLVITTGDRPFDAAWPDSVRALHACLDRDGNGVLTSKEANPNDLAALVRLATGGTSAPPTGDPDVGSKDGVVTSEELAEALRPALGPFRIQVGRLANGRTDALFDHLDRDKDGQLTRSELAAIAWSLRRLDLDDNEMITAEELEPFNNPAVAVRGENGSGRRPRFTALPPAVERISGESSLRLARLLMKKYDKGPGEGPGRPDSKLSPAEFAIDPNAFDAADANGDGAINTEELRRYLDGAPVDVSVDLSFPTDARARATARVGGGGGEALPKGVQVQQLADDDVEIAVGRVRLDVHVDGGEAAAENARRALLRRFKAADANQDGYLDGKELAGEDAAGLPLAGLTGVVDRDGDGKLYEKELIDFVDRQVEAARGRVVLTTSDQGRAIFGILDSDRDLRLSARELMRTVDRVTSWDGDDDGRVSADEIPYHFQITIARGELSGLTGGEGGAGPRSIDRPKPVAGPDWFRQSDRNRDGDVSRREFLGPREPFDRLDRDKDGLIDADEARAAKAPGGGVGP